MSRLTPRRVQFDHPAARVRESQHGRSVSGPTENERSPRSSVPSVRTRRDETAGYARELYAANHEPARAGGLIRGVMICALVEAGLVFAAVAVYLAFGTDPMRALVPGALAVGFLAAAYVVTVDS